MLATNRKTNFYVKKEVQIIIRTTGRVIVHLKRKTLNLNNIKMIVLDKAD